MADKPAGNVQNGNNNPIANNKTAASTGSTVASPTTPTESAITPPGAGAVSCVAAGSGGLGSSSANNNASEISMDKFKDAPAEARTSLHSLKVSA